MPLASVIFRSVTAVLPMTAALVVACGATGRDAGAAGAAGAAVATAAVRGSALPATRRARGTVKGRNMGSFATTTLGHDDATARVGVVASSRVTAGRRA